MERGKPPRVLGLVGSARRNGNTEILVDEILHGAADAGAVVEKVLLSKQKIAPCTGCEACQETGECVFKDDMPGLWTKMQENDAWVLGTPVYWWGPTAQMKLYVDRWYSKIFLPQDRAVFRDRRVILAIPLGDADPAVARHTVGMFTDALSYLRANLFATILAPGVNDKGQVREYPHLLEQAREAGRKAVGKGA